MPSGRIKVLIVDDSTFMRKALTRMLNSDPLIKVIGEARDGEAAVNQVRELEPDVVTLDVQMPGMNGLEALKKIMALRPTPVLMVSSVTNEGGEITFKALEAGAVDFIDKSSCHTAMDILDIADSLVKKVKVIAGVDLKKITEAKVADFVAPLPAPSRVRVLPEGNPSHLVAIGASTGGPMSLEKVLTGLPADYPGAILVVQHMPVGFTRSLAERFNTLCKMEVVEAKEDDVIQPGKIFIGPAGYHLKIKKAVSIFKVALSKTPRDTPHVPSVDVMMESVAEVWPGPMLGVVMTGMGADGAVGVKAMKAGGATIIAQNEETCVVYGMPKAAKESGAVDRMVALNHITYEIYRFNKE
jgi:two-component system, chemotaxis family, protein-glutamate methylesterase/glutaminase